MDFCGDKIKGYSIGEELGHGTFSEVYAATHDSTGEEVAVKCMHLTAEGTLPLHVQRELTALETVQHTSIISLKEHRLQKFSIALVLELCTTDLFTIFQKASSNNTPLPPSFTKAVLFHLLSALDICHLAGFTHRDVSPGNILFTAQGQVKLSDFGQARQSVGSKAEGSGVLTPTVGCRWYKAPELLFGAKSYTSSIDIWSIGCIFGQLLSSGQPFFPGTSDIDQVCRIFNKLGTLNESLWPGVVNLPDWGKLNFPPKPAVPFSELLLSTTTTTMPASAIDLLQGMLNYDPERRPTARQALQHAYFEEEPVMMEPGDIAQFIILQQQQHQ